MNKKLVRLLCLLLTCAALLPAVVSCQKKKTSGNGDVTLSEDTTDEYSAYISNLGVKNYDGRKFVIAARNTSTDSFFTLHPDDQGFMGYAVSDAMYTRDQRMMNDYGIEIAYKLYPDNDNGREIATTISNSELLGAYAYDMVTSNITASIATLQVQQALYNIEELPVIDSNKPWWSSYFWEGASYNNALYFTAGQAAGGGFFATPYVMMCNLELARDVYMQDGSTMDMFGMVESGDWTLENFEYIIQDYTTDLDSDGEISVYDDRLAYAHCRSEVTAQCHYVAAGMNFSTIDSEGKIVVNLSERVANMVERMATLFDSIKDNFNEAAYFQESPSQQMVAFKNKRALFFGNSMSYVDEITDMASDYAIIPCPKASSSQTEYYSGINLWTPGYIAFPMHCGDGDKEFVGYTAELLGYWSYVYVKPVVYDKVLCLRLARDGRQIKIMDTIYSNLYVDLNYINDFAMSSSLITDCIMDVTKSFESQKQSIELVIDLEIKKFIRDMSK